MLKERLSSEFEMIMKDFGIARRILRIDIVIDQMKRELFSVMINAEVVFMRIKLRYSTLRAV